MASERSSGGEMAGRERAAVRSSRAGWRLRRRPVKRVGRQFVALRDGTFRVRLADWERALLKDLPRQLCELLATDDPSLRRLFPAAYHADAAHEEEYQRYMREEILASRIASAQLLERTADAEVLSGDELLAWMNSMNAIRLVLGTQLDVSEETVEIDADDPRAGVFGVYGWLGLLVERSVGALQGTVAGNTE